MAKPKTPAERVAKLRSFTDLSRRQASELAGLSPWTVGKIEKRGGDIEPETAKKIAEFFGCSSAWLLLGIGESPSRAEVREAVAGKVDAA